MVSMNRTRLRLWYIKFLPHSIFQRLYLPFKNPTIQTFVSQAAVDLTSQYSTQPSISYSNLLSQCVATKSLHLGMVVHAHMIKFGFSNNQSLKNHLVTMYSKCHHFGVARKLVDQSAEPDLVSWSALISGFVQNGLVNEALSALSDMCMLGVKCNEFTFPSVLKACSIKKDLNMGKKVHGMTVVTGFDSDGFVANALVVMYAKCGQLGESRRLFGTIEERNVVLWNALFSCYMQSDFYVETVGLFKDMVQRGVRPNEFSLSIILNACAGLRDGGLGRMLHGILLKLGHDSDQFSKNALVDMYAKAGESKDAVAVFREIKHPDIVSWNAVIAGCVLHECNDLALMLLDEMKSSGTCPNLFTFSSALKCCAAMGLKDLGRQLHSSLLKMDTNSDLFSAVGLIDMYSKCEMMDDARRAFELMPKKDIIAWNALISGYSLCGDDLEAVSLFAKLHHEDTDFNQTTLSTVLKSVASLMAIKMCKQLHALSIKYGIYSDFYVINSLLDGYGKCNYIGEASKIFEERTWEDLVAYTSMITAYSQYGDGEEALKLYLQMQHADIKPDAFVCSSLLNACSNLSAYEQGKQLHVHTIKFGFMSDIFASNSLVNMYAKCGSIEDAGRAFSEIPKRGIVSWSAMIGGLAQHGQGKQALQLFSQMLEDGVPPNHITLVSVLCACNHCGLVSEGKQYFETMEEKFGINPTQEHYACMIDLLGRSGKLNEAMELVNSISFEADASVWGALLGAARIHKNVEVGQKAAEMLFVLEPEKSGTHVLLANIYASAGMWENVAKVRKLMKESNVKKEPGMSWLEVKDKVYTFIVGDRSHSRSDEIYAKLDELSDLLSKVGYRPIIDIDLHNVNQSEKEKLLYHHSEKLAVAFGLIATPPGAPIRVKKNLRVCVDCHTFFKFVCKIVSREIIVRDINRFHHFKDGSCSCGDYW
ncbi:pentatricopeptide repeat-containing protein At5g04780, mitochondrial-like [Arachis stenosperma]|uniref:pentatricopeptide repeat-containing protein At5g04780, mitochondrial-like n=1 Tax=Arachis stenosperma TaxID=217475 RepID=UPI0025AD0DE3|nr:pentatricopeptide repeat-containing protein At5g04780, mitochondrial-like [Arachis stenosperma]XP_057717878.1 pentatricopeptide repeat-containing protein At5g04780, mitochondrial-like [Arachis stenosperma]XP_057717879.1 pentatricopeptide repeat-containing protein At5g04780, mitochondrial-like [Arachis stenosperma]